MCVCVRVCVWLPLEASPISPSEKLITTATQGRPWPPEEPSKASRFATYDRLTIAIYGDELWFIAINYGY